MASTLAVRAVGDSVAASKASSPLHSFVGDWQLGPEIGRGGMAVVYSATSTAGGSSVAVKVMRKQSFGEVQLQRLRDEIRSLQGLRHHSIITLHRTYEDDQNLLLVMEKAEGGELFDRIVEVGHFSEEKAADVTRQLMNAVAFMHSRGVIHRDIKPEKCAGSPRARTAAQERR